MASRKASSPRRKSAPQPRVATRGAHAARPAAAAPAASAGQPGPRAATAAAATPPAPPATVSAGQSDRHRMIAEASYYLAEARGFAPGSELDDWLAAETLLTDGHGAR